jgi:hypothetical protein
MRPIGLPGLLLIISISLALAGAPETFSRLDSDPGDPIQTMPRPWRKGAQPPQMKTMPLKKAGMPIPIPGGQQPSPQQMEKVPSTKGAQPPQMETMPSKKALPIPIPGGQQPSPQQKRMNLPGPLPTPAGAVPNK